MIPPPLPRMPVTIWIFRGFFTCSVGDLLYKHHSLPLLGEVLTSQVLGCLQGRVDGWPAANGQGGQKPHMAKKTHWFQNSHLPQSFWVTQCPKNILFLRQRFNNHLQGGPLAVINGVTSVNCI